MYIKQQTSSTKHDILAPVALLKIWVHCMVLPTGKYNHTDHTISITCFWPNLAKTSRQDWPRYHSHLMWKLCDHFSNLANKKVTKKHRQARPKTIPCWLVLGLTITHTHTHIQWQLSWVYWHQRLWTECKTSHDDAPLTCSKFQPYTCLPALQAQIRAGMVADNPRLRDALQQASSSSDSFASDADASETTGKFIIFL